MHILAGLGNPGGKYARNRHNIGFMALDRIAEDHGFGPWKSRFQAQVSEGRLGSDKVLLLKPDTFMNRSGQAVGDALRFFKLEAADVTVLHDELDLAPGKCRVKTGGGHAGHNGLRSIHAHIGEDYHRVRLGIGHPGRKDLVAAYVLHDFAKADGDWLEPLLQGISDGVADLVAGDGGRFQNAVALRVNPPRSGGGADKPDKGKTRPKAPENASPEADQPKVASKTAEQPPGDGPQSSALQRLMDKFR